MDRNTPKRLYDTLAESLTQGVETVTRNSGSLSIHSASNIEDRNPPDDIDKLHEQTKQTGIVNANLSTFINEVLEVGVRVEADDDETEAYFNGGDDVPDYAPEGGYLENCAVIAGEKHQPFEPFLALTIYQRRSRGTILTEYLKPERGTSDADYVPQGFKHIRPETVSARTYENTNILVDPDDTDELPPDEITPRGEAAAYVQYDDTSILGGRIGGFDRDSIPLSQNDVLKQVYQPGIGGPGAFESGVFGMPQTYPVRDEISEYNATKRDRHTAVQTKAYGIWDASFQTEFIETPQGGILQEWSDDDQDEWLDDVDGADPGDIIGHDGSIELDKFEGDVPDLNPALKQLAEDILTVLPAPKYPVGYADDINRDVTTEQSESYERSIREERGYQEREWTQAFRLVAERHPQLDPSGVELKIEPEEEDSPILSLEESEIEKILTYSKALNELAGPKGGPATIVDMETLLTDIAQLPEDTAEEMAGELEDAIEDAEPGEDEGSGEPAEDEDEVLEQFSERFELEQPAD